VGVIGGKPCAALAKVSRAPKKDEVRGSISPALGAVHCGSRGTPLAGKKNKK
jgi:hypothetical protein